MTSSHEPFPPILVWAFMDAPQELRALSTHGGDEDWVASIPPEYQGHPICWMEQGTPFGVCDVYEYPHPFLMGYVVRIGAHA